MPEVVAGKEPQTLAEALARAVRDVLPSADRMTTETIAIELDRGVRAYWGPDHGITSTEMLATARDVENSTRSVSR